MAQLRSRHAGTPLYERVANSLHRLIASGAYSTGDRIPSVRQLNRDWGISFSTVLAALQVLEERGLIEARSRSGHFVARRLSAPLEAASVAASEPADVSIGRLAVTLMQKTLDPGLTALSGALPAPDLLPNEAMSRCFAAVLRGDPSRSRLYDVPPGCRELRVQVSRRASAAGCTFSPEDVVITSGCQEAVILSLMATCQPGDVVAVESPAYYNFLQAAEVLGLRALEVTTHPDEGMDIEALKGALDRHRVSACLLSTNVSNPLGGRMPVAKRRELVALLTERTIPLIEDDVYGDLVHSGERLPPGKAFDETGNVLFCSSFSKTIAPGYRIGYLVPGRFAGRIEHLKFVLNTAASTPAALAVADFLSRGGYDRHLGRARRAYAARTTKASAAIAASFPDGTKVSRPQGGYLLWVECPSGVDAMKLNELALAERVAIAPGVLFSVSERYSNCLRINAAAWSDETERAIRVVGRLARSLAG